MATSSELANWNCSPMVNSQPPLFSGQSTDNDTPDKANEDVFTLTDVSFTSGTNWDNARDWPPDTSAFHEQTSDTYLEPSRSLNDSLSAPPSLLLGTTALEAGPSKPKSLEHTYSHPSLPSHNPSSESEASKFPFPSGATPLSHNRGVQIYSHYGVFPPKDEPPSIHFSPQPGTIDRPLSISDLSELSETDASPRNASSGKNPPAERQQARLLPSRKYRMYVDLVRLRHPVTGPPLISASKYASPSTLKEKIKVPEGSVHASLDAAYDHAGEHNALRPSRAARVRRYPPSSMDVIEISSSSEEEQAPPKRQKVQLKGDDYVPPAKVTYSKKARREAAPRNAVYASRSTGAVQISSSPPRSAMSRPAPTPSPSSRPVLVPSPRSPSQSLVPDSLGGDADAKLELVADGSDDAGGEDGLSDADGEYELETDQLVGSLLSIKLPTQDNLRPPSPVKGELVTVKKYEFAFLKNDQAAWAPAQHPEFTARFALVPPILEAEPWKPHMLSGSTDLPRWENIEGKIIPKSALTQSWGTGSDLEEMLGDIDDRSDTGNTEIPPPSEDVLGTTRGFPPSTTPEDNFLSGVIVSESSSQLLPESIMKSHTPFDILSENMTPGTSHMSGSLGEFPYPPCSDVLSASLEFLPPGSLPFDSIPPSDTITPTDTITPNDTIAPHLLGGLSYESTSPRRRSRSAQPDDLENTASLATTSLPVKIPARPRCGPVNGKRRPLRGAGVDARKVHRARAEAEAAASASATPEARPLPVDVKGKGKACAPPSDEGEDVAFSDGDADYRPGPRSKQGTVKAKWRAGTMSVGVSALPAVRQHSITSIPTGSNGPGRRTKIRGPPPPGAERTNYCHQCRRSTTYEKMLCSTCPRVYCSYCVGVRYPEIAFDASVVDFSCPSCNDVCNCTYCSRKRGEEYISTKRGRGAKAPIAARPAAQYTPTPPPPSPFVGIATGVSFGTVYGVSGERLGIATVGTDRTAIVVHRDPGVPKARQRMFVGMPQEGWRANDKPPEPVKPGMYIGRPPPKRVLPVECSPPPPGTLPPPTTTTQTCSLSLLEDREEEAHEMDTLSYDSSRLTSLPPDDPTPPRESPPQPTLDCSPDTLRRICEQAMAAARLGESAAAPAASG